MDSQGQKTLWPYGTCIMPWAHTICEYDILFLEDTCDINPEVPNRRDLGCPTFQTSDTPLCTPDWASQSNSFCILTIYSTPLSQVNEKTICAFDGGHFDPTY